MRVSIPFKRESISKVWRGRRVGSATCFNSLQTGKHIQRGTIVFLGESGRVSIPFKRESISKDKEYVKY